LQHGAHEASVAQVPQADKVALVVGGATVAGGATVTTAGCCRLRLLIAVFLRPLGRRLRKTSSSSLTGIWPNNDIMYNLFTNFVYLDVLLTGTRSADCLLFFLDVDEEEVEEEDDTFFFAFSRILLITASRNKANLPSGVSFTIKSSHK